MPLHRRTTALMTGRFMSLFRRTAPLLAAGFMVFATGVSTSTWAQDATVYIGGNRSARGSVDVDMSVLDDLGGPGATARSPANQRLTLTPPGSATAKKAQPPRKAAAKPSTPKATAPKPGAASKPSAAVASKAPAAAPSAPPSSASSAPPSTLTSVPSPPPEPIDVAAVMPAPLPDSKPAPARAAEQGASSAPRDLKPTPTPSPVTSAAAKPDAAPAPRPNASAQAPMVAASATAATPAVAAGVTTPTVTASAATSTEAAPAPRASERPQPAATVPTAPPQSAALPPAQAGSSPSRRIPFTGEAVALTDSAKGEIKQIATSMSKDQALRVQVMAYASGGDDAGKARRLSLSRALAVRSYLIEQGIGSTRIDVRALGNATEGGPADRVDLVTVNR